MRTPEPQIRSLLWVGAPASVLGFSLLLAACMHPGAGTATAPSVAAQKQGVAPVPAAPAPLLASAAPKPDAKWAEFHGTIQPFFAKNCYRCHGADDAENDMRLDLFKDAASLQAGSETLEKAYEKLSNHKMPPRDEPQPAEAEVAPVVAWLRTFLAGDPSAPINPGRVTLRRLNRAEYNNTIRDLLAVDVRPADTFPVDDSGYGFDNNGDVLSMAPVLMEKYLAAASVALDKAILADPVLPPPVKRWEAATLEGTIPKSDPKASVGRSPYTVPVGRVFNSNGEIYVDYDVPADGEYILRVHGYGTQGAATHQRPSVAFLVDGTMVQKPFTITDDQRNPTFAAPDKAPLTAGHHRISLAFLNGLTPEEYAIAKAKAALEAPAKVAAVDPNADDKDPNADPNSDDKPARVKGKVAAVDHNADDKDPNADDKDPNADDKPARALRANGAPGRGGARAGKAGRGAVSGPPKSTLGVIALELEGPLAPTPDRMPESYRRVMVALPSATVTRPEAAEKIIRRFATRAFRRPARESEVTRLMAIWSKADSDGRPFEQSIDVTLQAVLVSPAFLFRMELDPQPGEKDGIHTLNEYELATRLSYFLWSSMPDDELFALAEDGKLRANLDAQVRRMLKDPKSSALVQNFADQWLQLRGMQNAAPDPQHFPEFDEALREAMTKETELFFNAIVQEDRNVLDFIGADFTFVNERLAKHYGMTGVTGDQFRRVSLAGDQRGGILTQASVLTVTSYPARTSPVLRGKWVLENLLDAAPPPPPPNVPALAEGDKAELTGSIRQRMEQHRKDPKCAVCHEQMDGIGFALENFDAVGAWRTQDATNEKIDASGTLPGGKSFNGPAELRTIILAQSDQFSRCLVGKMMTFALGRGLEPYDRRTTDAIVESMKKNGNRFSTMIEEIVRSDAFQKRNGKQNKGDS
jgi:hypothetical protein